MLATAHLHIDAQQARLLWAASPAQPTQALRLLPMPALLALLPGQPPSLAAIEAAIEHIEEAVMPLRARLPSGPLQLHSADHALRALAQHVPASGPPASGDTAPAASQWLGMDAVEALFTRLAARAGGRPAAQDALPTDSAHSARLILVRELLHHWAVPGLWLPA